MKHFMHEYVSDMTLETGHKSHAKIDAALMNMTNVVGKHLGLIQPNHTTRQREDKEYAYYK